MAPHPACRSRRLASERPRPSSAGVSPGRGPQRTARRCLTVRQSAGAQSLPITVAAPGTAMP
eukprot:7781071-Alexandrium_andersonii.AAC.1